MSKSLDRARRKRVEGASRSRAPIFRQRGGSSTEFALSRDGTSVSKLAKLRYSSGPRRVCITRRSATDACQKACLVTVTRRKRLWGLRKFPWHERGATTNRLAIRKKECLTIGWRKRRVGGQLDSRVVGTVTILGSELSRQTKLPETRRRSWRYTETRDKRELTRDRERERERER